MLRRNKAACGRAIIIALAARGLSLRVVAGWDGAGFTPQVILYNDANTFADSIGTDGDGIIFTSVADTGVPCSLGIGSRIGIANNPFYYIGSRSWSSNRDLLFAGGGAVMYNNSGCGSLCFTGKVNGASYVNTHMTLAGISSGESLIAGDIPNYAHTYYTRLTKSESGTWRLTGNNTFTGWPNNVQHVRITGGMLIADYVDDVI